MQAELTASTLKQMSFFSAIVSANEECARSRTPRIIRGDISCSDALGCIHSSNFFSLLFLFEFARSITLSTFRILQLRREISCRSHQRSNRKEVGWAFIETYARNVTAPCKTRSNSCSPRRGFLQKLIAFFYWRDLVRMKPLESIFADSRWKRIETKWNRNVNWKLSVEWKILIIVLLYASNLFLINNEKWKKKKKKERI